MRTARTSLILSGVLIALGIAIIVRTALEGVGGGLGFLMGGLLIAAAVLRIYFGRMS